MEEFTQVSLLNYSRRDYCGNVVYGGNGGGYVSYLYTPEGYARRANIVSGDWVYYYTLKDHLGSVRSEFKGDGTNVGYTHYYPSGIEITDPGYSQSLQAQERYNSKEFQSMFGLNWHDSKARWLDLSRIHWPTPDLLCEKRPWESPYCAMGNNPVNYIDPTGMSPIFDEDGNLLGTDANGWKGTSIVMNKDSYKEGMSNKDALKAGTKLNEYGKGIKISDESWTTVTDNGGTRMNPYLQNNSENTVFYKPEGNIGDYKDAEAYAVGAGKDMYMRIDGVKTENMKPNEIFKVPDGGRVIIDNNQNISYTNPLRSILNYIPDPRDLSHNLGGLMECPANNFIKLATKWSFIDSPIKRPANLPAIMQYNNKTSVF